MSDLLKFFLPCPRSVLLLPVAWPAAECPVCFLLRLVARIRIFLLQLMFVRCWKFQLCFITQCTEGSPALFWSKMSKLPMQWGILLQVPPPASATVMDSQALTGVFWCSLLPPAPLPTADPPEWPGTSSRMTLIHARAGFQMDTSPLLAYGHVSHRIDGVLMMLQFQPSFLDMLGWEWGELGS